MALFTLLRENQIVHEKKKKKNQIYRFDGNSIVT